MNKLLQAQVCAMRSISAEVYMHEFLCSLLSLRCMRKNTGVQWAGGAVRCVRCRRYFSNSKEVFVYDTRPTAFALELLRLNSLECARIKYECPWPAWSAWRSVCLPAGTLVLPGAFLWLFTLSLPPCMCRLRTTNAYFTAGSTVLPFLSHRDTRV